MGQSRADGGGVRFVGGGVIEYLFRVWICGAGWLFVAVVAVCYAVGLMPRKRETMTANEVVWRSRIVEYTEEAPDQLLANPRNFRTHPGTQADALRGVLREVGVVQNVLANKRTGMLIDGHLRVMEALKAGQPSIPVTWVDLSEEEEALILATLDPLSAMAGTDAAKLDELLREVSTGEAGVQALLDGLAFDAGIVPGSEDWAQALGGLPDGDRAPFQQMTFTVSDEQADTIKRALRVAQQAGPFDATGNENSNGNALARLAEAYLG